MRNQFMLLSIYVSIYLSISFYLSITYLSISTHDRFYDLNDNILMYREADRIEDQLKNILKKIAAQVSLYISRYYIDISRYIYKYI